jgi:hypothetical protein
VKISGSLGCLKKPSLFLALVAATLQGCFKIYGDTAYPGPPTRPESMLAYYAPTESYSGHREEIVEKTADYTLKHISIDSYAGPITIDYFQGRERSDNLVFVFPVLGGKNFIEKHFARFFVESGIDAAIVNRSNEFKDPKKFDTLEEVFRLNVIRDRLAIDFFENEYSKRAFGTFGISRGAINVALTAGIDNRLRYNVLVLGGTDLVDLFRDSNQPRIEKYIQAVRDNKGYSKEEFFGALQRQLKTDPKNTAQYLDSRDTLLVLGIFDRTVPFKYGLKLREQIGNPETVFLVADHYVGLLYTQTVSVIPPRKGDGLFPFPYVEHEAIGFYRRSFQQGSDWRLWPFRVLQTPFNLLAEGLEALGLGFNAPLKQDAGPEVSLPTDGSLWTESEPVDPSLPTT